MQNLENKLNEQSQTMLDSDRAERSFEIPAVRAEQSLVRADRCYPGYEFPDQGVGQSAFFTSGLSVFKVFSGQMMQIGLFIVECNSLTTYCIIFVLYHLSCLVVCMQCFSLLFSLSSLFSILASTSQ